MSVQIENVSAAGEAQLAPSASTETGTPLSNTVPANNINQNNEIKLLRYGIDSIYLSYQGKLSDAWGQRLARLKEMAQSEDPRQNHQAQVKIGNHIFEVQSRGRGKFKYVIKDNWYDIQIAGLKASALPMAYVQLSSELITHLGVEEAEKNLRFIINTLGKAEEPNVSRIDPCVDFCTKYQADFENTHAWVTRAKEKHPHYISEQFTGMSFGRGGSLTGKLYDKTLEIQKSKKFYLLPLWQSAGWNELETVWRLEFQVRGRVFTLENLKQLPFALSHIASIWNYCMREWLRLSVPNPQDSLRSRWPNHPLWDALTHIDWEGLEVVPLCRPSKNRTPSDEALFINGLGAITSFMAREGITDISEGFGEYIAQAIEFHDENGKRSFDEYVERKIKEKNRRFNTALNSPRAGKSLTETSIRAEQYRKAKQGE